MILPAQAWVWWQAEPRSGGTVVNALWARHQWVGEPHAEAEYRALGALLWRNRITDVFFHAGPFETDGGVSATRYPDAGELDAHARRHAPGVRVQAYLGQSRREGGRGILNLDDPAVRDRVLATDRVPLDLGFDGIHYDIEPVYPDDAAFLELLDRTRELTRARGRILSVALERPTRTCLRKVADRADQVAIVTYDVSLPTKSLVGWHFAHHIERVLEAVGDRTAVFVGVPTYRPLTGWAEGLPGALRGVRRGLDALRAAPDPAVRRGRLRRVDDRPGRMGALSRGAAGGR